MGKSRICLASRGRPLLSCAEGMFRCCFVIPELKEKAFQFFDEYV